jgi:hypothetical protein
MMVNNSQTHSHGYVGRQLFPSYQEPSESHSFSANVGNHGGHIITNLNGQHSFPPVFNCSSQSKNE